MQVINFVDDSILPQLAENGGNVSDVQDRLVSYARFAEQAGAHIILEAWSSVGELAGRIGAGGYSGAVVAFIIVGQAAALVCALMMAGVAGSAICTDLGYRKIREEVDAMEVMGVDPFQALVIPRLAALLIMLPLLTFVGVLAGLLGGLLVTWSQLDLGPVFFLQRIEQNVGIQHLWVGLSKAPVFAIIVAAIGCRQGLAVGGDVESLGRRVTAAVVQAIFAIIVIDAVFALIYLELGV